MMDRMLSVMIFLRHTLSKFGFCCVASIYVLVISTISRQRSWCYVKGKMTRSGNATTLRSELGTNGFE